MTENRKKKFFGRRIANRLLHFIARVSPGGRAWRVFLHRLRGVKIGDNVWIGDDVYLENEYPERVEIQDNSKIMLRTAFVSHTSGPGRVIIEKNVFIGAGAMIVCHGGQTIRIGEGAVIGAGAVIKSNVAPHVLMMPPESKAVGLVTASPTTSTREDFLAGLKPLPTKSQTPRKPKHDSEEIFEQLH
jgi:carbonic anhydrase/acetyltransferase-like protein (isoleucine patch superfamily)